MAKRTQTNEIVNVSCECECKRELRKKTNVAGCNENEGMRGKPIHKHDENVLQFAVKFARCVYFQIMRKLFAYAPNKGAGRGMSWGMGCWGDPPVV